MDWAANLARGGRGEIPLSDSIPYVCPGDGGDLRARDDVLPGELVWWCARCGWSWDPEDLRPGAGTGPG
jgi:hypothetical protein